MPIHSIAKRSSRSSPNAVRAAADAAVPAPAEQQPDARRGRPGRPPTGACPPRCGRPGPPRRPSAWTRKRSMTPLSRSGVTAIMVASSPKAMVRASMPGHQEARCTRRRSRAAADQEAEHQQHHHREDQADDHLDGLAGPVRQLAPGHRPGVDDGAAPHRPVTAALMPATSLRRAGACPGQVQEHLVERGAAHGDVLAPRCPPPPAPRTVRGQARPSGPSTGTLIRRRSGSGSTGAGCRARSAAAAASRAGVAQDHVDPVRRRPGPSARRPCPRRRPGRASTTEMRSASWSASSRYWVVSRTVVPPPTRERTALHTSVRPRGSSPVVGSSRNSTSGSRDQARGEVEPAPHAAAVLLDRPCGRCRRGRTAPAVRRRAARRAARRGGGGGRTSPGSAARPVPRRAPRAGRAARSGRGPRPGSARDVVTRPPRPAPSSWRSRVAQDAHRRGLARRRWGRARACTVPRGTARSSPARAALVAVALVRTPSTKIAKHGRPPPPTKSNLTTRLREGSRPTLGLVKLDYGPECSAYGFSWPVRAGPPRTAPALAREEYAPPSIRAISPRVHSASASAEWTHMCMISPMWPSDSRAALRRVVVRSPTTATRQLRHPLPQQRERPPPAAGRP